VIGRPERILFGMLEDIALAVIIVAAVVGLWLARRTPSAGARFLDADSRFGPTGEPTGFDKADDDQG